MHKTVKYFVILFSLYMLYLSIAVILNGVVNLKYNVMSMDDINNIIHYALLVIVYAITILLVLILLFLLKRSNRYCDKRGLSKYSSDYQFNF